MSEGERRLSAVMFTDMVGYTSLAQRNESLALELLNKQRSILRACLIEHNGREVKTIGDGFLVEFASAVDAVKCACAIQKAFHDSNLHIPSEKRIVLRVGIHVGEVIHREGDVYGDAVNVASRIEPLARPGGICITQQVYDHVRNKIELRTEYLRKSTLKNVEFPVDLYTVELPFETPPLKPAALSSGNRIAVLPLTNISPDPKDEYFADGMTEELISTLSKIAGLRVIARTSVARYKATTKPIVEIGKDLGVGTILEGSVRKSSNKIRITAQLIDASTEEHLWAQDYDRDLEDIFSIQSDIAKRIAKALKVRVMQSESLLLEKKATGLPEAYSLYLKGLHSSGRRTEDDLKTAVQYFEDAIKRDPRFALAYTGLADAYSILASYSLEYVPPREAFPKARIAAEKALALDTRLAEAHASLGLVKFYYEWDWPGAEAEFKRALELNPGYAQAHQYYADYVKSFGRFDEALSEMGKAHELDPLSFAINTGIGHVLYLSRQYDRSIEHYRKIVESDPAFIPARLWFGRPYMQKGMFKEAIEQLIQAVKLSNESTVSLATLGQAYASAGQQDEAEKILDRLLERSKKHYVPSYWIALVYMSMNKKDEAFAWLERAYHERSSWLVWAKVEPRFDALRADPRFMSLLSRMRLLEDSKDTLG